MSDKIEVVDIIEHDDGSATVKVDMAPEVFSKIFNVGFVALILKGIESEKGDEL